MIKLLQNNTAIKQRYKIILNYVIGPILFIILSWTIYRRIQHQKNLNDSWLTIKQSLIGPQRWKLYIVILLSLLNWAIETRKWQILVKPIQHISFIKAFKSVLSGLSLSLFMPNRIGEYVGRMVYMDEGNRLRSIALSMIGSISQLLITLLAGLGGTIYLKNLLTITGNNKGSFFYWIEILLIGVIIGIMVLGLIYYRLGSITNWIQRFRFGKKIAYFIEHVRDFNGILLTRILSLSLIRFGVFIVQYILLLQLFNVSDNWIASGWLVSVLLLVLAIVPMLPVAEIGIRGEVSIQLFGMISDNTLGIIATAGSIWLINIIIPAISGSLFIVGIKLFKK